MIENPKDMVYCIDVSFWFQVSIERAYIVQSSSCKGKTSTAILVCEKL